MKKRREKTQISKIRNEKEEKLQLTPQKYKGLSETTTNKYMPIKWTTSKKWKNSWKGTIFQD